MDFDAPMDLSLAVFVDSNLFKLLAVFVALTCVIDTYAREVALLFERDPSRV